MTTSIRGLDKTVYRKFKAVAAERGKNLGSAMTEALQQWTREPGKMRKKRKSIFDIKPFKIPGSPNDLSERVDEVLYGWKKK